MTLNIFENGIVFCGVWEKVHKKQQNKDLKKKGNCVPELCFKV